jgi:hypothetical protein
MLRLLMGDNFILKMDIFAMQLQGELAGTE